MRILIAKLSSLGDVIHAMPALADIHAALRRAQIDWVVERAFAPLVGRCDAVDRVIACDIRRWRNAPFDAATREQWVAFRSELGQRAYDAIIDLQGLSKSALVAHLARLKPGGKRFALANRTRGSSYEAPTRWVADVAVRVEPRTSAVERSRVLCAKALGYAVEPGTAPNFGLRAIAPSAAGAARVPPRIAFVHGTSRADKQWPVEHWVALGLQLNECGLRVALVHGCDAEQRRSEQIAAQLQDAEIWPRLPLDQLCDRLASCAGVIGVDSGLSHVAVALDLPHVQLYNFDSAWRTGPVDRARQTSVFARPTPGVQQVWRAWCDVAREAGAGGVHAAKLAIAR